jgi:hypothetical protein
VAYLHTGQLSARACRHADQEPMPAADAAQRCSPWLVILTSRRARPVLRLTHMMMPMSGHTRRDGLAVASLGDE